MSPSVKQAERTERLSVNVSMATAQALRALASDKSTTVTEVVRQAVALLKLVEDERKGGSAVQLADKASGTVREILLL